MSDRTQKKRGSRTHGRGKKAGRGKGKKGGSGNAGRFKHRRLEFIKKGVRRGGERGFSRPEAVVEETTAVNVGKVDLHAEAWGEPWSGDGWQVDLTELGVDRLLGGGKVLKPLRVVVGHASARAVEKVEDNGGEVVLSGPDEEDRAGQSGADESDADDAADAAAEAADAGGEGG